MMNIYILISKQTELWEFISITTVKNETAVSWKEVGVRGFGIEERIGGYDLLTF